MNKTIYEQTKNAISELYDAANLKEGNIIVIGCSTSEVLGSKIGSNSSPDIASEIFNALYDFTKQKGLYLAIQCCEHLNRTIITERTAVPFAEVVNVIPQPKAGGSLATKAYQSFHEPVAIEDIKADAGLDIGFTMIGMHLKKVAVPLRLKYNTIGKATVLAARTRPKFVGGVRAIYDEKFL